MAIMADCVGFQAQIASIIEVLANSAVVEICKLVDDGYAALRSQMDQERGLCGEENDILRRKLREMDVKMRTYERRLRRRDLRLRRDQMHIVQFRPPEAPSIGALVNDAGYVGEPQATVSDNSQLHILPQEVKTALPLVKKERVDCDLDLKVELNIRADGRVEAVEPNAETNSTERRDTPDTHTLPNEATEDFHEPPAVSEGAMEVIGTDAVLKSERQTESTDQRPPEPSETEPSAELLNNLGLELALMQERVSQLGAPFIQTGSNTDTEHPSCSYSTQADIESPSRLFPSSAHEMGGFTMPFDMTVPPSMNQRQPQRERPVKEPMVCNFCGRVFPSVMSLEVHQRVHTGQRPYSCLHCGKAFAQPNNLRVHLLIHSGERRYRCSVCGKSFISSSHLKRHRTVHTQEKPYTCARCGQSFSQLCSVRRHRQQSRCGL